VICDQEVERRADRDGRYRRRQRGRFQPVHQAPRQHGIAGERNQAVGGVKPQQPAGLLPQPGKAAVAPREPLVPEEIIQDGRFHGDNHRRHARQVNPFQQRIEEQDLQGGAGEAHQPESAESRALPQGRRHRSVSSR
jgi:hypothetical protein